LVIPPDDGILPPPLFVDLPQVVYRGYSQPAAPQADSQWPLMGILFNLYRSGQV
jgi:hypothetical protein|tara:strand:+ start:406 stop:567 length:162 start_codon:yes stop_codon:yes gene_type:complete